jgi:aminopeptidase N
MSSIIPLTKKESEIRKFLLTDINETYSVIYDLFLVFRKKSDNKIGEIHDFEGYLNLDFTYYRKQVIKGDLFLNFIGQIHSIIINSKKIKEVNFKNNRLTLDFSFLKNGNNELNILFSGNYNNNGIGLHHHIDPIDNKEYLYTQFQPYDCQRLFPCFDQPDIKAILKLKVLSPKDWKVLSNTLEKSNIDFNRNAQLKILNFSEECVSHLVENHNILAKEYRLYTFEETPKISTYLFALCLGPYHCVENKTPYPIKLRIFMKDSLKEYGYTDEIFKIVMEAIKWFSNYFGYSFPSNKYDQIFCPDYPYGAMENFGLVTINEEFCFKTKPSNINIIKRCITILHELAHMWFGNLVTMKWWDDLWLNESFSTFISYLCAYEFREFNQIYSLTWALFNDQKRMAITSDQMINTHPIKIEIKDTSEVETKFDDIIYKKGSSIIKQIFYYLGEKNFSNGLIKYFNEFKYKNVEFEDFVNKMIEASGNKLKDLRELCYNWILREGVNEISLDIEIEQKTKKIIKFVVKQKPYLEQYPYMITHFVDFLFLYDFYDFSKNKVFKKVKIEPKTETIFDFSKELEPKLIFLNYNDYGYMKLDISYMNMENLKQFLFICQDSLLKTALIRALYDTFFDEKINSIEFLDIILPVIEDEQNELILSILLEYLTSIIFIYLPLKYISTYKSKIFCILKNKLENQLGSIEPNQEIMKLILIHINGYSIEEEHKKYLLKILNLDTNLMNQNKRFSYIKTIYSSRIIPLEEKKNLLKKEILNNKNLNNSIGIELFCDAILPDRKNKEKLWKKITEEYNSDKLENIEAIIMGFAPIEQYDIVQDFLTKKFFEVFPKIDKNDDYFLSNFISYLAPFQFTNNEIIKNMTSLIDEYKDKKNKEIVLYLQEVFSSIKRKKKEEEKCEKYLEKIKNS